MWTKEITDMIVSGVWATLYMTLASTILGYVFGLPMGVLLAITDKEGLTPNAIVYKILDIIANIVRSIPFLILLILLIPFTKLIVGQSYGSTATVVPLVIAAIPFIARMVESSIKEVDPGVIEAARSMGASNMQIVMKVLLEHLYLPEQQSQSEQFLVILQWQVVSAVVDSVISPSVMDIIVIRQVL